MPNPIIVDPKNKEEVAIRMIKAGAPLRRAAKGIGVSEQPFHNGDLGGGRPLSGEPNREHFQLDANLENFLQVAHIQVGDDHAASRQDDDQIFERQPLQRLTDRRPTQAELGDQPGFVDQRGRRKLQRDDLFFDYAIRLAALLG